MADLQFIAEQLQLVLDKLVSLRDQHFVLSTILQRFEHRDRTDDGEVLALQQQINRLQRRVEALEEKSG